MKRILVYGMTNNKGGIEAYIMNIFRAMDKTRIMFDFVTDFDEMVYADEVIARGAKVYYIPAKRKHPVGQLRAFSRLLKAHPEYDTVYFNILDAGSFYNMLPAVWRKRRIVVHSHNGDTSKKALHSIFRPWLVRYSAAKLACSEAAARFMFGESAAKDVTVIHNAINLEALRFNEAMRVCKRAEMGLKEESFTICHIARMDAQKNPLFMLEIFEAIRRLDDNAMLLYAGGGPMEQEVKAFAEVKVLRNIRFLGMRSDVPELLQAADAFLLPSLYEGLPVSLIEAQAAGLSCFVSTAVSAEADITGLVEFISLNQSAEFWAEKVLEAKGKPRPEMYAKIQGMGYDIASEVKSIEKLLASE